MIHSITVPLLYHTLYLTATWKLLLQRKNYMYNPYPYHGKTNILKILNLCINLLLIYLVFK